MVKLIYTGLIISLLITRATHSCSTKETTSTSSLKTTDPIPVSETDDITDKDDEKNKLEIKDLVNKDDPRRKTGAPRIIKAGTDWVELKWTLPTIDTESIIKYIIYQQVQGNTKWTQSIAKTTNEQTTAVVRRLEEKIYHRFEIRVDRRGTIGDASDPSEYVKVSKKYGCGHTRAVNGKGVSLPSDKTWQESPWNMDLQVCVSNAKDTTPNHQFQCGKGRQCGAILTRVKDEFDFEESDVLITATSCVAKKEQVLGDEEGAETPKKYKWTKLQSIGMRVVGRMNDYNSLKQSDKGEESGLLKSYEIDDVLPYEQESLHPEDNGIALIRLKKSVDFDFQMRGICHPKAGDQSELKKMQCKVDHWGEDSKTETIGLEILEGEHEIECIKKVKANHLRFQPDTMFCGNAKGGKKLYKGDVGRGLICEKGGQWTVYGIMSFLVPEAPDEATIWTDTAVFYLVNEKYNWVFNNIKTFSNLKSKNYEVV